MRQRHLGRRVSPDGPAKVTVHAGTSPIFYYCDIRKPADAKPSAHHACFETDWKRLERAEKTSSWVQGRSCLSEIPWRSVLPKYTVAAPISANTRFCHLQLRILPLVLSCCTKTLFLLVLLSFLCDRLWSFRNSLPCWWIFDRWFKKKKKIPTQNTSILPPRVLLYIVVFVS